MTFVFVDDGPSLGTAGVVAGPEAGGHGRSQDGPAAVRNQSPRRKAECRTNPRRRRASQLAPNVQKVVPSFVRGVYRDPSQRPLVGFRVVVDDRAVPVVAG